LITLLLLLVVLAAELQMTKVLAAVVLAAF
jgi:hypothetical protein